MKTHTGEAEGAIGTGVPGPTKPRGSCVRWTVVDRARSALNPAYVPPGSTSPCRLLRKGRCPTATAGPRHEDPPKKFHQSFYVAADKRSSVRRHADRG